MRPNDNANDTEFAEQLASIPPRRSNIDLSVLDVLSQTNAHEYLEVGKEMPAGLLSSRGSTRVASLSFAAGLALGIASMLIIPRSMVPTQGAAKELQVASQPSRDESHAATNELAASTSASSSSARQVSESAPSRLVATTRPLLSAIDALAMEASRGGQPKLLTPRGLTVVPTRFDLNDRAAPTRTSTWSRAQPLDGPAIDYSRRELQRELTQSSDLL